MKRTSLLLLVAGLVLAACGRPAEDPGTDAAPDTTAGDFEVVTYGEEISEDGLALSPADVAADPNTYQGQTVRVEGTVTSVCQQMGCWLAFDNPGGPPVRVDVPRDAAGEYAWTFPRDLGRVRAVVEGTARADSLDVDQLRHYAEDAGRPQGEIDAIDASELTVSIAARGVRIERPAAVPADPLAPPAAGAPDSLPPPADATLPEGDDAPAADTPTGT